MILTIEEKIKLVEEKIFEVERTIRNAQNPSEEEIDAQIETGHRQNIIDFVSKQKNTIDFLENILKNLKNGIDTI